MLNKEKTHLCVVERMNRSTVAWTKNEPDFTGRDCGIGSSVTELDTLQRETRLRIIYSEIFRTVITIYVGRSGSKERFAIQRYLLTIGKKQNMQVLSHTFTYFST